MAGFLDETYGVKDARKERRFKLIALITLSAIVIGGALFFSFRNWKEERTIKHFLSLLEQKQYQEAYKMWGCSPETPCKGYAPDQFNSDWGPESPFANVGAAKVMNIDNCGNGVLFDLETPSAPGVGLWVQDGVIGFAPWARCPGRHLHFTEFLKSLKARFS